MAHLKTHKDIRKYFDVLTNWALLRRKSRSFVLFKYFLSVHLCLNLGCPYIEILHMVRAENC